MSDERNEGVGERRLIGVGTFASGLGYIILFSALVFLGLYYGGLRGYLLSGDGNLAGLCLILLGFTALGGLLYGASIFPKTEDNLFRLTGLIGICLFGGFTLVVGGCFFIYPSLIPSNSVTVSSLITIVSGIALASVCYLAFSGIVELFDYLRNGEKKIAVLAWMLFLIPCLAVSSFMGIRLATQRNIIRDEDILAQSVSVVQTEETLEILLPLEDRDYVYRSFKVIGPGNKKLSLYYEGRVGRVLDANKIFLPLSVFADQAPDSLTFVSSNGKEGAFPVQK